MLCTVKAIDDGMAAYNDRDLNIGDIDNFNDKLDNNLRFYSAHTFNYEYRHYDFVHWYDKAYTTAKPLTKGIELTNI